MYRITVSYPYYSLLPVLQPLTVLQSLTRITVSYRISYYSLLPYYSLLDVDGAPVPSAEHRCGLAGRDGEEEQARQEDGWRQGHAI